MVVAVFDAAKAEVGFARAFFVAVENDLRLATFTRSAKVARVLPAGDIGNAVGKWTILDRNGLVILLDSSFHLAKKGLLQVAGICHQRLLVSIFSLQVSSDFRIKQSAISENGLPVVSPQPCIFIRSFDPVYGQRHGFFRR